MDNIRLQSNPANNDANVMEFCSCNGGKMVITMLLVWWRYVIIYDTGQFFVDWAAVFDEVQEVTWQAILVVVQLVHYFHVE